jgi:hypothetical protein
MLDIEATAAHLGISPDAVRKRLQRGTLAGRKIRGRWFIILPDGGIGQELDGKQDDTTDIGQDSRTPEQHARCDTMMDTLRAENDRLWDEIHRKDEQIAAWIDEAKRKDMLIAHLQEHVVELSPGASESPESDEKPRGEPQDTGYVYHVPEPVRRPWWKFWER